MGKHAEKNDFKSMSGELPQGELKDQLADRTEPLERLPEISQSPIETF